MNQQQPTPGRIVHVLMRPPRPEVDFWAVAIVLECDVQLRMFEAHVILSNRQQHMFGGVAESSFSVFVDTKDETCWRWPPKEAA